MFWIEEFIRPGSTYITHPTWTDSVLDYVKNKILAFQFGSNSTLCETDCGPVPQLDTPFLPCF